MRDKNCTNIDIERSSRFIIPHMNMMHFGLRFEVSRLQEIQQNEKKNFRSWKDVDNVVLPQPIVWLF